MSDLCSDFTACSVMQQRFTKVKRGRPEKVLGYEAHLYALSRLPWVDSLMNASSRDGRTYKSENI